MNRTLVLTIGIILVALLTIAGRMVYASHDTANIMSGDTTHDIMEKKYRSLTVEGYEKAIADTSVFRLDVRTEKERKSDGFIPGTIMIDVQSEDFLAKAAELLPKDRVIAVNCRSGRRSKVAAEKLSAQGYDVIELDGGFNAWKEAGKTVVIE